MLEVGARQCWTIQQLQDTPLTVTHEMMNWRLRGSVTGRHARSLGMKRAMLKSPGEAATMSCRACKCAATWGRRCGVSHGFIARFMFTCSISKHKPLPIPSTWLN